jgi:hypothetical protein
MKKDSFIIYKDFYPPIEQLSDEQLGKLFRALFRYQIEGIESADQEIVIPFRFFVNQFRIDDKKYQRRVESAQENGKKGGRPKKKPNETQKTESVYSKPDKAVTVTVTDNVTDTVTDNETEKKNKKDQDVVLPFESDLFSEAWDQWKQYKKDQFRFRYKSGRSEQTALKKLQELSQGSEERALLILEQSVANGWSGLFPLKNEPKKRTNGSGIDSDYIQELKNRLQ